MEPFSHKIPGAHQFWGSHKAINVKAFAGSLDSYDTGSKTVLKEGQVPFASQHEPIPHVLLRGVPVAASRAQLLRHSTQTYFSLAVKLTARCSAININHLINKGLESQARDEGKGREKGMESANQAIAEILLLLTIDFFLTPTPSQPEQGGGDLCS